MMKKLIVFILIVLFLLPSAAYAVQPLAVNLEGIDLQTNQLSLYFNTNYDKALSKEQLTVKAGAIELPVLDLKSVEASGCGITYLFLVDVSGSIKEKKLADMKSMMNGIVSRMGEKDNGAIMLVGNDSVLKAFESGKDNLQTQITAIENSSQDTNLYAAIIQALDILNTDAKVQTKKCLIVLSDGEDDFKTGYTREEVNTKVEEANIPIFTIAMLSPDASSNLIEASKVFASFARQSAGGMGVTYGLDQTTTEDISGQILNSIRQGYIAVTDLSGLTIENDQSYLEINIDIADYGNAKDGYTITSSLLRDQIIAPTPTPEATLAPAQAQESGAETAAEDTMDEGKDENRWLIIVGVTVCLLLICLLLLIGIRRRSRKKKQLAAISQSDTNGERTAIDKTSPISLQPLPKLNLLFTRVGIVENETYTVIIEKELIIGRDFVKAQLVFSQDELLSSQHCRLVYQKGGLYLEDMNSTNGTYVNGVPVRYQHLLEQDDIILIGSMELRINWKVE